MACSCVAILRVPVALTVEEYFEQTFKCKRQREAKDGSWDKEKFEKLSVSGEKKRK